MVEVEYLPEFRKRFKKLSKFNQERVSKLIAKLKGNPLIGKPMRNERKGTREVYLKPFRLSYAYILIRNKIYLLDIYHKDKQ